MKLTKEKALYKAAAYCSKAERCEFDIRKKLVSWELDECSIVDILTRLQEEKFFDEARFCESFIRDKIRFNRWGKNKIAFELRKKRISEVLISDLLHNLDDKEFDDPLLAILRTKSNSVKASSEYERRIKLIRFALGRGYSLDQIKLSLNRLLGASEDDYSE